VLSEVNAPKRTTSKLFADLQVSEFHTVVL
jgi:hypothetical protein